MLVGPRQAGTQSWKRARPVKARHLSPGKAERAAACGQRSINTTRFWWRLSFGICAGHCIGTSGDGGISNRESPHSRPRFGEAQGSCTRGTPKTAADDPTVPPPKLWPKQPASTTQPAISKQATKEAAKEKARPPPLVEEDLEVNDPPTDTTSRPASSAATGGHFG
eukprot:s7679_g5.t1